MNSLYYSYNFSVCLKIGQNEVLKNEKDMVRRGEVERAFQEELDSTKAQWQFFLSHFLRHQANQIIYGKTDCRGSCFT